MRHENLERLQTLANILIKRGCYFLIYGDFNCTPDQIPEEWLRRIKAEIITPRGAQGTCRLGQHRMIDYLIVSSRISGIITCELDHSAPWKAHHGLWVGLNLRHDVCGPAVRKWVPLFDVRRRPGFLKLGRHELYLGVETGLVARRVDRFEPLDPFQSFCRLPVLTILNIVPDNGVPSRILPSKMLRTLLVAGSSH